ncbi:calmodulin-binding protein 25-like [Triticum urartu]|uniref:VQ domain-containing protein n=1 Tax=Triticum urartu TaxID=4572 RepID=A0A8R7U903_TRIUA|nr:calmodulin-binding protein 25-like [Triticum urartu]
MDALSCFAPPAMLCRSFADAAIARALHFSLSAGCSPVPEPSIVADLGACSAAATTASPSSCGPMAMLPPAAPSARCRLGPAGGRAGKRRPRPSKRVPTTYISTDAATFRLMVQHVTGAEADPQVDADASLGVLLSPFDFDHLLPSDPAAAAAQVAAYALQHPPAAGAEQPCFPTLDSWNVMYGNN